MTRSVRGTSMTVSPGARWASARWPPPPRPSHRPGPSGPVGDQPRPEPPIGERSTKARVQAIIPALEDYVSKGMALWQVPGAAVGVVVGDDVVYARGFGLRDLSASAPVDANTVFGIGSATKAFAAATEAIMVDRGKMRWTDKVLDHDPAFRLSRSVGDARIRDPRPAGAAQRDASVRARSDVGPGIFVGRHGGRASPRPSGQQLPHDLRLSEYPAPRRGRRSSRARRAPRAGATRSRRCSWNRSA